MKRKYLDMVMIAFFCVLFVWRFVFYGGNSEPQGQSSTVINTVIDESIPQSEEIFLLQTDEIVQKDMLSSQSDRKESESIWDKIVQNYLSDIEGIDMNRMEGVCIKPYEEDVRQDDWIYNIQGAYITKKKSDNWDFVPDYSKYEYDEKNNLINDYSYVSIKIKIERVAADEVTEVYLNSIDLRSYNKEGEFLDSVNTGTAALNKPEISSYFQCPLKIGEELETEIVFVMQDCYLSDENYYIIDINNTGVTPFDAKDFSLVRVPLGQGVEKESEDIWDKIAKEYLSEMEGENISHMEGLHVKHYDEEIRQDDWLYTIQEIYITKEKDESWDFVPDSSKYEYDEKGNLINDYSYVSIKIKIERVAADRVNEVYLNSICLRSYNKEGELLDSVRTRTAALNKPHIGSYFQCPLKVGEELETEIVFVMQDCYLSDENYYIITINNRGVTPFKEDDISLVRVPLGRGAEDETTDFNRN